MKSIFNIFSIFFCLYILTCCVDESLTEETTPGKDYNIEEFSEGFSLSFDVMVDELGSGMNTRATVDDLQLAEWESYLDPEEFRILFFDDNDKFLFESTTRWLTEVDAKDGNRCWRVGVPVFQYLSDDYNDQGDSDGDKTTLKYNWDAIVDIMRTKPFKVAILANRPSKVEVPELSDWIKDGVDEKFKKIAAMGSALNGPFWTAENSIATDLSKRGKVAEVIDLHHCQFDPLYYSKSLNGGYSTITGNDGWYDFLMKYDDYYEGGVKKEGASPLFTNVPFMGAAASWVSTQRQREVGTRKIRYYRLPIDQVSSKYHVDDMENTTNKADFEPATDEPQYIPMYGIQRFEPLTTWTVGTTYNLSQQVGSQTGNYDYQTIFLLRSVVKIELRIPMYDGNNKIEIDNKWAQIWFNNYMSRCEPMDVSTSTRDIWNPDHSLCEWKNIHEYGLLDGTKNGDVTSSTYMFKEKLSWFYGIWKKLDLNWDFIGTGITKEQVRTSDTENYPENPRVFNPLTQRLQGALITDCYLPIIPDYETNNDGSPKYDEYGNLVPKVSKQNYHRWVIYCGERNMDDPNYLGDYPQRSTIAMFRIPVKKNGTDYICNIPFVDYSQASLPNHILNQPGDGSGDDGHDITDMSSLRSNSAVRTFAEGMSTQDSKNWPLPLLRNHFYRLTVNFGDRNDINVSIIDSEVRNVGGIVFN